MKTLVSSRPRIHLTSDSLAALKTAASGTHSFFYGKLLEAADEMLAQKLPDSFGTGVDMRYYGDILPALALSCLLSGEDKYADFSREILKRLVACEDWGDNLDLVTGHFLAGASIAYDWLYDYIPADEKRLLADKIAHHARILHTYAAAERIWWHDFFLHNWNYVISGGLAYAAAALDGENPDTHAWSDYTDAMFTKCREALPDDGSYPEGHAYMTYGWECLVRYFDLARQLYGQDHFGADWLKNAPYLTLYSMTPKPRWHDNCMVFGDGPRHCEWHGPVHLFLRSAREYKDSVLQGFAMNLAKDGIGLTRTGSWLNMLWYDPSVAEKPHDALPTSRFFKDMDFFSARSGWGTDAVMFAFKCGNNACRKTMENYPGRDLGSGHAHPDAASFQVYAFGEWLAVDTGYTHYKLTRDHNTLVVNGLQQLGGERIWFDVMECYSNGGWPKVTHVESTPDFDYARGDASTIYRPQAGLVRFIRHMVFLKDADILIVDELEADRPSVFEWRLHADDEITGSGNNFEIRKNEARLAVNFIAPGNIRNAIARSPLEARTEVKPDDPIVLSVTPAEPTAKTTFVTLLTAYCGAKPAVSASASVASGVLTAAIEKDGVARTLTLDMDNGKVTLRS